MALLDDDSATELFKRMKLEPKDLEALDKKLAEHGDEPRHVKGPDVMDAGQLRLAFAELGDTVEREQLFALMQQADPESEGVMPLERFLVVVRARREQLEKARREKEVNDAYLALGGSEDREKRVASDPLVAIASDFVGDAAAAAGLQAVVAHKMKAVQELLDMGGQLDEEDEAELKDTKRLDFEEVKAFSEGLRSLGPAAVATAAEPSAAEVLR